MVLIKIYFDFNFFYVRKKHYPKLLIKFIFLIHLFRCLF